MLKFLTTHYNDFIIAICTVFYKKRFDFWSCVTEVREVFEDDMLFPSGSFPDAGEVDKPFRAGHTGIEAGRVNVVVNVNL